MQGGRAERAGLHVFTTQLYTAAQVTSGGMTKMVHGLSKARLIERIENPEDGRSRLVRLTSKGKALAEEIVAL